MAFLAYGAEEAHVYMVKVPCAVRKLHSETLTFICAWRDMRGLISKSESLQLSDCSRAKKFLVAFQASDMLTRRRCTKCPWYRRSARNALRFGRATLASVYSKVSSLVSRRSGKKRRHTNRHLKPRKTGKRNKQ
ncbi:hypothetical protein ARMGADRAFT_1005569 [Armillaria gallica]|uniref:Uncharacterized protein n=1 Tax=Armillaria gallica TaxID=47427 RepID=A0A2H3EGY3_ARMGA|nr:hypothetical protein ARMGADRAFT_1005569 [Armillaria gallica]